MARVRKIEKAPAAGRRNYYLADANFLANRFIPRALAPDAHQKDRIEACNAWWDEIDEQLNRGVARVYVPDICIAEAFKVLAKKYYQERWFPSAVRFNQARTRLRQAVTTPSRTLRAVRRRIRLHDVQMNRDIVVAVDRFFEVFHKHRKAVSLVDLLVVSTGKYLMDFYDIPKGCLHIVTLDRPLRDGSKHIAEIPNAYDPTLPADSAARVFR